MGARLSERKDQDKESPEMGPVPVGKGFTTCLRLNDRGNLLKSIIIRLLMQPLSMRAATKSCTVDTFNIRDHRSQGSHGVITLLTFIRRDSGAPSPLHC